MDQSAILGKICTYNSSNSTRLRLVQFFCWHAIFSQIALSSMRLPILINFKYVFIAKGANEKKFVQTNFQASNEKSEAIVTVLTIMYF